MKLLLVLLFTHMSFASVPIIYTVGNKKISLLFDEGQGLIISEKCAMQTCDAMENIKEFDLKKVGDDIIESQNIASVVCTKISGKLKIATDQYKNHISLCQFEDGSIVSCGSLVNIAQTEDEITEDPNQQTDDSSP